MPVAPATAAAYSTDRSSPANSFARGIANRIGFDIEHQSSGGGSDGNFTGAMGVPTLDGLGVAGAMAHTLEEHIEVASLVPRAKLFAGLLRSVE